jgi:acyl-CoA synthetase (AMP-forming)/AMP-acid ligase II
MSGIFPDRLWDHAQGKSELPAIHFLESGQDDLAISYKDLYLRSADFACALKEADIQPGEVVVLIINYRTDLLYAFWGAILHGAIPSILPFLTEKLNPDRYLSDLTSLISVTRPSAIITYDEFRPIVDKAVSADSPVRSVLYLEEIERSVNQPQDDYPGFQRSAEEIVLLQHSSGTTGLQKGVALSHQAVFNQIESLSEAIRLDLEDDVIFSWLPLYHDMGLIAGFILPILAGIPLVLMSPFDWVRAPYRMFQAVTQYQGTLAWLPNFAYNFCARKIRDRYLEGVDLSSWRAVINCSEPVRWESHQAFYEKFASYGLQQSALQTSYAMAENTFGVTQSNIDDEPPTQNVDRDTFLEKGLIISASQDKPSVVMMSSGIPLTNTRIRVQDPEGNLLPDNRIGEIALQSNCMLNEYYNRPSETAKSLQDGWFLTGDFGYLSKGEIYVTGRKKDLIIVGGKNIYPGDLEELLYEIPGVHPGRAVVFGLFNEKMGTEDVVVIAETDLEEPQARQDLADLIRAHITQNSPVSLRQVKITDAGWIIKTSSGKTSRSANKARYLSDLETDQKP